MRKTLLLTLAFITLYGCTKIERSDEVWIQTDIQFDYAASNPMAANETWENTTEFNMKDELKTRYGIDLDESELLSFQVLGAVVLINSSRCQQLSKISTVFDFPELDPFAREKTGQDLIDECTQNMEGFKIISFDENSTDADVQEILATDFAAAINRGENLKMKYSMTAAEAFNSQESAISLILKTKTKYLPK